MPFLRRSRVPGGGILRTIEKMGVARGVFGASKGWFYVGVGLWTLRKVRALGQGRDQLLLSEPLRPGDRIVIANGVATIDSAAPAAATDQGSGRSRRSRRKHERARRRELVTYGDLSRRERRRARRGA